MTPLSACASSVASDILPHFTGKERDSESGLDHFGARYYASSMGRWMSPDWADKPEAVPYSKLDDPQSLNLYEYVGNNPLSRADADGHDAGAATWFGAAIGTVETTGEVLISTAVSAGAASAAVLGQIFMPAQMSNDPAEARYVASLKNGRAAPGASQGSAPTPRNNFGGGQILTVRSAVVQAVEESGKKAAPGQRAEALKENDGKCVFCRKPATEADHAIPRSRGGDTTTGPDGNLQPTCQSCNRGPGGKGAQTSEEFLQKKQGTN